MLTGLFRVSVGPVCASAAAQKTNIERSEALSLSALEPRPLILP